MKLNNSIVTATNTAPTTTHAITFATIIDTTILFFVLISLVGHFGIEPNTY